MVRVRPFLIAFALATVARIATTSADASSVPANNDPRLNDSPPPRPPVGDADAKARRLFTAIQRDDPSSVLDFFLPRQAFALIKAMADPDHRHDQLVRAYVDDVHELHASLHGIERATFERFELARRGGWVHVREEANRLPYWASRHSHLYYRLDGRTQSFEIHVLITWDDRWYVTHLNDFH